MRRLVDLSVAYSPSHLLLIQTCPSKRWLEGYLFALDSYWSSPSSLLRHPSPGAESATGVSSLWVCGRHLPRTRLPKPAKGAHQPSSGTVTVIVPALNEFHVVMDDPGHRKDTIWHKPREDHKKIADRLRAAAAAAAATTTTTIGKVDLRRLEGSCQR